MLASTLWWNSLVLVSLFCVAAFLCSFFRMKCSFSSSFSVSYWHSMSYLLSLMSSFPFLSVLCL